MSGEAHHVVETAFKTIYPNIDNTILNTVSSSLIVGFVMINKILDFFYSLTLETHLWIVAATSGNAGNF